MKKLPISALNLAPVRAGSGQKEAIEDVAELAKHLETLDYQRYWIAEHHNTATLMSSATSILIKHVLEQTTSIRVGSGGVMLPNHTPLAAAEQFGTMAVLYPGRVDMGLGRAPGTDMATAQALRRSRSDQSVHSFPQDVEELLTYFGPEEEQGKVKAYPGTGTDVPLYILGSSTDSARLAARLGLPYAFAAHFAPTYLEEAVRLYRRHFQPSKYLDEPYVMICANVIADETDEEAAREMTTLHQFFLNVVRGTQQPLQPPVDSMDGMWHPQEQAMAQQMTSVSFVGSRETITEQLQSFQERFEADEIMAVTYMYDREKEKRSFTLFQEAAEAWRKAASAAE
ncbi:LLM class flavin-dependent oxidoreductase [Alkalicoccus urumqiensis]|uniref:LLM class flavin-dependent oxidoreductase n=1 Tax=Alkalicoccus urumqiensis TaxID=1548213 RepID=A0A2P6MI99_ALKUR|nr:LLM class flavin-dependent oxidoreductase [Alkalicoccus urumqiensis]PRO65988.1 LLM class flavin-dependent oxidoreductase [Alkalicoccus urumqiensis]